jgi:hypothetical protein
MRTSVIPRTTTLAAGAAATLAMMAASRGARSPAMPVLEDLAATAVAPPASTAGEVLGVAAQLVSGGLFAHLYEIAFDRLALRPGWLNGAALGLMHGAVAGTLLAAVPALHPRVPEERPAPGAFLRRHGRGAAVGVLALHVLYGALVGWRSRPRVPAPGGPAHEGEAAGRVRRRPPLRGGVRAR